VELRDLAPLVSSKTFAAQSAIAITGGVKTAVAASGSVQVFSGSGLNGSALDANKRLDLPQTVAVSTASSVGAWTAGSTIVVAGTNYSGAIISASLVLTAANGGEQVVDPLLQGFASITSITVPAQPGTATLTIDVRDLVFDSPPFRGRLVGVQGDGNVALRFGDGRSDVWPLLAGQDRGALFTVLYGKTTTAFPLTVGW
jgi:hypothetical protein